MAMEWLLLVEEDAAAAAAVAAVLLEDGGPFESSRRGSSSLLLPLMAGEYSTALEAPARKRDKAKFRACPRCLEERDCGVKAPAFVPLVGSNQNAGEMS